MLNKMKKQDDNIINWFGQNKPQKKAVPKMNSNKSINYLGLGPAKTSVNFLGLKNNKHKMSPSPFMRSHSKKKKRMSKWGDADYDGTPNWLDCDPMNPFKDFKTDKNGNRIAPNEERKILEETKQKMKQVQAEERANRYAPLKKAGKKITGFLQEQYKESRRRSGKSGLVEEKLEKKRQAQDILNREQKEIGETIKEKIKKGYTEGQLKKEFTDLKEKEEQKKELGKAEKKINEVQMKAEELKSLMKVPGLAGSLGLARRTVDEKIAKGETPSNKELKAVAKLERKSKMFGDIQQEGKFSREILTKVPGGQVGRVLSGAGVTKSGEYSSELKAKSARVRRMTNVAAGALFGPSLTQQSFRSEPRGRGRPAGPSGEYKIGGKPVYEAEFQQYSMKQNALNRMLPSQQQSATLNPEYIAYLKAQKAAERGETQTVMTEDGMPMEGIPQADQTDGMPRMGSSMMQTGQQQIEMQQKRAYNRATPDEVKAAQYQAQAVDNPLMAPNFMKGELKAAGGSILTPIGPSILEAPQVFKGEMRNVVKTSPDEGEVKLSERPQTNPYGDEWLDIEIGSGKPVIRRRPREKWMTGEAL